MEDVEIMFMIFLGLCVTGFLLSLTLGILMAKKREEKMISNIKCAKCGGDNATIGSLKHPICVKCFQKYFKNDYRRYNRSIEEIRCQ